VPPRKGPYEAGCREEIGRVMEPRKGERGGKPTVSSGWKAAVLGALWQVPRTPPGSESGACLHRGNSGTWERQLAPCDQPGGGDRVTTGPGGGRFDQAPSPTGRPPTESSTQGIGDRATSADPQDGQRAVVASHTTGERGEVRPKRPPGGKATSGRAFQWVRYTRETPSSPSVSPYPHWSV